MLRQDAGNGDELSVSGAVQGAIGLVHAASNDFAVPDENAADGCLVALQCKLGLVMMSQQSSMKMGEKLLTWWRCVLNVPWR
jgi:hypothetical protein